jgi:SecD/SecF fusion protein
LAIVTIATMFFDISIPSWAYWLWMGINSTIQIDTVFIIAILTTMWYSINDTIIVFDRIRENLQNKWTGKDILYWKIFEDSLWQTMKRSIWTSLSTLLVVIAMFVFGSWVIQSFAFVIWVWVVAWSFSSIFIAAPLAYMALWKYKQERKKI